MDLGRAIAFLKFAFDMRRFDWLGDRSLCLFSPLPTRHRSRTHCIPRLLICLWKRFRSMDICNLVGGVGVHNLCVGYMMCGTRPFLGGGLMGTLKTVAADSSTCSNLVAQSLRRPETGVLS